MQYLCAILPLWEFLVACRYTACLRTDCVGEVVGKASYWFVTNIIPCLNSSAQKHLTSQTNNLPPPQSFLNQAVYRQTTRNSHRGKIVHKYCIFCSSNNLFVIYFLTIHIFNYLHILIFYNKKDPTYDILYEFNVYTDTPSNLRHTHLHRFNILDCNNT